MKKFGFVGLGIIGIWLVDIFISRDSISSSILYGGTSSLINLLLPMISIALAYHLLNDEEHQLSAYIIFGISFLTTIIIFFNSLLKDNEFIEKVLNFQSTINTYALFIISPFAFRSQSDFHSKYKKGLAIGITAIIILSKILTMATSSVKTVEDYKRFSSISEILIYSVVIVVGLSIANPIVGYTFSDGVGGSPRKMPKLVTVPTIPDNMANMTINQGINYGNMPVPDGVVASTPMTQPQPPVPEPVVETLDAQPVVPAPEASPAPSIDASEVAPELQFIIDNNKQ